jgi:NADPH:quinone reductase-like Zn-dependent oxidoreductase
MRAAGITAFGADVELLELPDPRPPAADELLIRVRAAAVANWDDIVRQGNWDIGGSLPLALGVEVAGEVLTAGAAARRFAAGDAVMAHPLPLRDQGAWAEQMLIPAEAAAPKPATVEWEEAAAFPVPALTAHQVLTEALEIQPGETLLVHGGGGVTGRLLIALAVRAGARVFATASERSADRLHAVGAEAVFDYRDPAWQDALRERVGAVDAVANAARAGEPAAAAVLRRGGRFATITGAPPEVAGAGRVANCYVRPDGAQLRDLAPLLGSRELRIDVASVVTFADAAAALDGAVAAIRTGAIVLRPADHLGVQ